MPTATTLQDAQKTEFQKVERCAADMLPYYAEEAAEHGNVRRGILWGIFLSGCLWAGIFALIFLARQ